MIQLKKITVDLVSKEMFKSTYEYRLRYLDYEGVTVGFQKGGYGSEKEAVAASSIKKSELCQYMPINMP